MREILSIIRKEFIQIRRDRRMVAIVLVSPILQLLLLGYAANLDVRHLPLAVCDLDRTPESRALIESFINSDYFDPGGRVADIRNIGRLVDEGAAALGLVVPEGFGNDIKAGRPTEVQVIVDGTESLSATIGVNAAAAVSARYSALITTGRRAGPGPAGFRPAVIDPDIRIWYNPSLKSRNFFVPGVLALVLMIMTMLLTSMTLVKEKEMGTMEQLIVTPIRPFQLLAGKLVPSIVIGLVDSAMVTAAARLLLGVPLRGNLFILLVMILAFILTTLGLGLFISTISHNQQQAMLSAVFVILPMMLLGGFVFPIENMPRLFQGLTYAIPIRYFFTIVRGIFLKGAGWPELWDEGAALLIIGMTLFGLSLLRFRKKLE